MSTRPYYLTEDHCDALLQEAFSWVGTPFAENCAVKGPQGGVSCVHFLGACHVAAGAIAAVEIPALPVEQVRHWHEHHRESLVLQWLEQAAPSGRIRRVDDNDVPMVGDLAVMKIKETEHHVGLWCGAQILHVAIPAGVIVHRVGDRELMKLVRCYYRIYEA